MHEDVFPRKETDPLSIGHSPFEPYPIVHEVLRTPGQPLDRATRTFVEPRFAHDFSRISINATPSARLQFKLAINQPGDVYEQEADRVAEEVMRMPASPSQHARTIVGKTPILAVQRAADAEDEEQQYLQRKTSSGERTATSGPSSFVRPIVHEVLRSPGQPLDPATRAFMEPRFGYDFGQVRVHTDAKAAESARAVNALAYTIGRDVILGDGHHSAEGFRGRRLLAHELTHVLQQGYCRALNRNISANGESTRLFSRNAQYPGDATVPILHSDLSLERERRVARSPASEKGGYMARAKAWIYRKQIWALRSAQRVSIQKLRKATPWLPAKVQGIAERIIDVVEFDSDILISLVLALWAFGSGFAFGLAGVPVALLEGVVRAFENMANLLVGMMALSYGIFTGDIAPAELWLSDVWESIRNTPAALIAAVKGSVEGWWKEYQSSSSDHQTQMIADLAGQIDSVLLPFAKLPRGFGAGKGLSVEARTTARAADAAGATARDASEAARVAETSRAVGEGEAVGQMTRSGKTAPEIQPVPEPIAKLPEAPTRAPKATGKKAKKNSPWKRPAKPDPTASTMPDIREQFTYTKTTNRNRVYESSRGELGTPGSVKTRRSRYQQREIAGGTGDDAGHRIGARFGAPGGEENLSPQNWIANRAGGNFYDLELHWERTLKSGKRVIVEVTDITRAGENRPFMRRASWTEIAPDGTRTSHKRIFANPHSVKSRIGRGIESAQRDRPADVIDLAAERRKRSP